MQKTVLIVGAGITGLVLAQALKKHKVDFEIFERDPHPTHRGKGWALYLHWSVPDLLSLLPQHLIDRLPECYVDPDATARGENGRFTFFNLSSGEALWQVPPMRRLRVVREKLRRLLMEDLDIRWGKKVAELKEDKSTGVTAFFDDGTSATGTVLVGCDGSRSRVRSLLCATKGSSSDNFELPVRFLGAAVTYPGPVGRAMQEKDPFCFQGGDPKTDAFMFFSFLDTPTNNDREDKDSFDCQVIVSWPYREGFLGKAKATEVPASQPDRLKLMKDIANGWTSPFRDVVQSIPDGTLVQPIRLEDWVPVQDAWANLDGRATLIGDAAHAMVMFRGEAANHGITDVKRWVDFMLPVLQTDAVGAEAVKTACNAYELELVSRTHNAVLLSRRACLDAHDYKRINDSSPLVSKRAAVVTT